MVFFIRCLRQQFFVLQISFLVERVSSSQTEEPQKKKVVHLAVVAR